MNEKIALAFSGHVNNNAVRGLMAEYGDALTGIGMSVVHLTFNTADLQRAAVQMSTGNVSFALTWLGAGQDLLGATAPGAKPENIWDALRIPLLKLHGDLPAYFVDRHRDVPRTAVNLYHAVEFVHFRRRWLPEARALTAVLPPLPLSPIERSELDLSTRRRGKLVFLKNGNSPAGLRRLWNERLPGSVSRIVETLADEITPVGLKPGLLHIGDFVAEFLSAEGIDPDSARDLLLFLSAQMDDYMRRVKSQMIVEAILDLPVLIQGSLWDHVDFTGRKAQLIDGQDYDRTMRVFLDQLGIIDMSPNVDTWPHDRVQRAAGTFSPILTNRQGWIADNFPGFEDMTFEFNRESIKARVSDAIAHPDRYLELGVAFGNRFRDLYTRDAFATRIVNTAALATLQCSANKPVVQPYFSWPSA